MINGMKETCLKGKKETLKIKMSHFIALGTLVKLIFRRKDELN